MNPVAERDLHAYVDGVLPQARRLEVEAYLAEHPAESEQMRVWAAQNAALRTLYDPVLKEPLPERLLAALAARRWQHYALAASLFAIGIAVGWIARDTVSTPASALASFARQAAVAHAVYTPEVRHPVEVGADEEKHLFTWLSKRLGTDLKSPRLSPLGFELVGGRLLSGPQGPVAQFMYQDAKGQRVTLYVAAQKRDGRDTAFRFSQEDRVSVFYWVDRNYGYALSGEIRREALLRVANSVYKQLNP
ncbi:MAG: anti-sigma factor [Betaproteobacteria bacterium]|nr:anti-sigma factor [Betaproteobacteria bacterium]MBI2960637.1 anti-sigma factor [Betaproteobacteria bacterium]